jgi:hypothetical protein
MSDFIEGAPLDQTRTRIVGRLTPHVPTRCMKFAMIVVAGLARVANFLYHLEI